ncbi:hypothetical protein CRUP_027004, partial [Coryphaenoides rupestris]
SQEASSIKDIVSSEAGLSRVPPPPRQSGPAEQNVRAQAMKAQIDDLEIFVLQRLWFQINHGVLKKILRVMPEKHLSRSYIAELESRFRDAEGSFQTDLPENIQGILDRMTEQQDNVPESSWRFVAPKSLLDNFQRSMRNITDNGTSQAKVAAKSVPLTSQKNNDCGTSRWKKGRKKTQPQQR